MLMRGEQSAQLIRRRPPTLKAKERRPLAPAALRRLAFAEMERWRADKELPNGLVPHISHCAIALSELEFKRAIASGETPVCYGAFSVDLSGIGRRWNGAGAGDLYVVGEESVITVSNVSENLPRIRVLVLSGAASVDGNCELLLYNRSRGRASAGARASAWNEAILEAEKADRVEAWQRSHLIARDCDNCECHHYATVELEGRSYLSAWNGTVERAERDCRIFLHSKNQTLLKMIHPETRIELPRRIHDEQVGEYSFAEIKDHLDGIV